MKNINHGKKKEDNPSDYWSDYFDKVSRGEFEEDSKSTDKIDFYRIFERMKKDLGLSDYSIDLRFGEDPYVNIFREEDGVFVEDKYVVVPPSTKENVYRGNLKHELVHISNAVELIHLVGLPSFVILQREKNLHASLAYKTIYEYLSWKAACMENETENSTLSIYAQWICNTDDVIRVMDVIAAHTAYYEVHGKENLSYSLKENDDSIRWFEEESQISIDKIADTIRKKALLWPMSIQEFEAIGKELYSLYTEIKGKT